MDTNNLRAEIQRITQPNGRKRFSKELRAKVKAAVSSMRRAGASQVKIAETLSISTVTVGRYLKDSRDTIGSARPVAVAMAVSPATKVTTPSGFEVEGLDVADIATLIRSLS